jgi:biopolymer transport protein ExbD
MGVSVDSGGGRGKSMNAELNLVPFIDLLSVCITFLLATAVWTQFSIMQVDQAIQDPNTPPPPPPDEPPVPPLTLHIRADGLWMGREIETGKNYPQVAEGDYDWEAVDIDLKADREAERTKDETQAIIVTDDGVHYEHMIAALDLTRKYGYDKTLLGGGPAQTTALPLPTAPGAP